jgi:hypothetical protein
MRSPATDKTQMVGQTVVVVEYDEEWPHTLSFVSRSALKAEDKCALQHVAGTDYEM